MKCQGVLSGVRLFTSFWIPVFTGMTEERDCNVEC